MSRLKRMGKAFKDMPISLMLGGILCMAFMLTTPLGLGNWIVFIVAVIHLCMVIFALGHNTRVEDHNSLVSVAEAIATHILWLERFITGSKQDLEDWTARYAEEWAEGHPEEPITYEALMDSHLVDMEDYHMNRRIEARIEMAEKSHTALIQALHGNLHTH